MANGTATRSSKRRRLEGDDEETSPSASPSPSLRPSTPSASPSSSPAPPSSHRRGALPASSTAGVRTAGAANKQHLCPQCPKTFARHEHMARHLAASHSSETLYECDECGKRFRRSDVLQRHQRLHQARLERLLDSADLSQRQQSALARVEAACLRCSSKKLKCDALRPACSRCARTPAAVCEYAQQGIEGSGTGRQPSAVGLSVGADEGRKRSQSSVVERRARFMTSSSPARDLAFADDSFGAVSSYETVPAPAPASAATLGLVGDQSHSAQHAFDPISLVPSHSHASSSLLPTWEQQLRQAAAPVAGPSQPSSSSLSLGGVMTDVEPSSASLEDKTLDDLLGWLDGPANVDVFHQGQIDWAFGDSPSGSSSLPDGRQDEGIFNWDQVKFLADLPSQVGTPFPSLSAHTDGSLLLSGEGSAALLSVQPQGTTARSPLDVLSAAAQLHVHEPRYDGHSVGHGDQDEAREAHGSRRPSSQRRPLTWTEPESSSVAADSERESRAAVPVDDAVSHHISVTGGRSRWNSPEPADEQAPHSWANRWNPELRETIVPHFTFATASEEHLMAEDMAHVPAVSTAAKVRMTQYLRTAAFSLEEQRRMAKSFETVNAETLNIYLQLFFHHFYAFFPFIHRATFSPERCDPRLLAALCSIGAFFSEVPGSRNSGIYLASLAQTSLGQATHINPELARFTSSFQTFLLVFLIWRSIGAPARQEHAEAFRSTYTTMIRRARLLEDLAPPSLPATATLEERWMAWIAWEGGRRTGWSVMVSETELTSSWSLPSAFVADEIKGQLPLDDRLWEAPSAVEWAQVAASLGGSPFSAGAPSPALPRQLTLSEACRVIADQAHKKKDSDDSADLERLAQLSPFGRLCVASALYLSTIHALRMATFCGSMFESTEATHERIRLVLDSAAHLLGAGKDQDIRAELLINATHLFHLVPLETLQTLSCRRGPRRMAAARKQLAQELRHDAPWKVPAVIRHAGQILRLAKQSLKRTPTEGVYLFYACVSLHAVSILALQSDSDAASDASHHPAQHVVRISTSGAVVGGDASGRAADPMATIEQRTSPLDSTVSPSTASTRSQVHSAAQTSTPGSTVYILESVGNLAHPLAARRILSLVARWLRDNDGLGVWPLSRSLAKILDSLSLVTSHAKGGQVFKSAAAAA